MNASELRIGNWVTHNGNWNYADHKGEFVWEERDWLGIGESCLSIDDVSPVPLTTELLTRFGFEKKTIIRYEKELPFNGYYSQTFAFVMGSGYMMNDNNLDRQIKVGECKSVHQLQNLYFALTGEELILTP